MKIIALVPVKNEAWILPTYISSVSKIAEEIIALDDLSTDNSVDILRRSNATVLFVSDYIKTETIPNMSRRRSILLEEGRKRGGTHFIWLDADEAFNSLFMQKGRKLIKGMQKGQKMTLRWTTLWGSLNRQRADGVWSDLYKDFIVFDTPDMKFENRFISESRTEGTSNRIMRIPEAEGNVVHFQFLDLVKNNEKQAYYRCIELLKGERGARRINATYSIVKEDSLKTEGFEDNNYDGLILPDKKTNRGSWYLEKILDWFNQYGIESFEHLEIWNVPRLKEEFRMRTGREPKARTYPKTIIYMNNIKNKLKNL